MSAHRDDLIVPDAVWDGETRSCYDIITHVQLPSYEGLCLFKGGPEAMVMNTWLEGATRHWQLICMGCAVPSASLPELIKKAA